MATQVIGGSGKRVGESHGNIEGRDEFPLRKSRRAKARRWTIFLLATGCAFLALRSLNSFLAVTSPVKADVLIVEGWLPDDAMRDAIGEFKRGGYRLLVTTGGPLPPGDMWSKYGTFAQFAAANLAAMGFETNSLLPLPSGHSDRDRTYASAVVVRDWLRTTNASVRAVNVYTLAAHARRTRLMFQKALGDKVEVGVFSHPDFYYDPDRWWASMAGFQEVSSETVAYAYARVIFPFRKKE